MSFSSRQIHSLIGDARQPLILEIGAHVGDDTREFVNCYADARVFCFEPDPRCCKLWKRHGFGENVQLFEIAIGDQDATTFLNLSEARYPISTTGIRKIIRKLLRRPQEIEAISLGQSSIVSATSRSDIHPWLVFDRKIKVSAMKLDTWRKIHLANAPTIDFIWTDVQGAEKRLIEGAAETLLMTRFVTLEYGLNHVHPEALSREETIEIMAVHAFAVLDEYSDSAAEGNLLFVNTKLCA